MKLVTGSSKNFKLFSSLNELRYNYYYYQGCLFYVPYDGFFGFHYRPQLSLNP